MFFTIPGQEPVEVPVYKLADGRKIDDDGNDGVCNFGGDLCHDAHKALAGLQDGEED